MAKCIFGCMKIIIKNISQYCFMNNKLQIAFYLIKLFECSHSLKLQHNTQHRMIKYSALFWDCCHAYPSQSTNLISFCGKCSLQSKPKSFLSSLLLNFLFHFLFVSRVVVNTCVGASFRHGFVGVCNCVASHKISEMCDVRLVFGTASIEILYPTELD